jgi:indolepyruvate ferredoxin oxidoreductase alpha subunit
LQDLLTEKPDQRLFLLGNEAIVRGAIEAGIDFAATYPGTPSSEIGNVLYEIGKDAGVYFEFSTNEKVATEVSAAASACGLRALTFMKHVGLNVAADAFMTIVYTGVRGGFVLVTADDPGCHSSQNEQDNRFYALLSGAPMLEPSSPSEAKEMVRQAFDMSEQLELPVMVRTTTRVNHMRGPVITKEPKPQRGKGHFDKDPGRFVTVPANARRRHIALLERQAKAREISEGSEFNRIIDLGSRDLGIVTSGAAFNYVHDFLKEEAITSRTLKLGMTHPLPETKCSEFIGSAKRLIVVEEGEPYLEDRLTALAKDCNPSIEIIGKRSGHFSRLGEYTPDTVRNSFSMIEGIDIQPIEPVELKTKLPGRPPQLCPGCPHRSTYFAVKKALKGRFAEAIFSTDIGCYTLGIQPPLKVADFLLCMGSSVDAAGGFSKATDQPVLAFLGDSTFFHSGVHGLINAVYNRHKFVYTILDNRTTAMTGHQPNPGMGVDGRGQPAPEISIEEVVRGCGVEFVKTVDPSDIETMTKAYKDALEFDGVTVIVAKRPCVLLEARDRKRKGEFNTWQVNQGECKKCLTCIKTFGCPAIYIAEDGSVHINEGICNGCGVCAFVCPFDAIHENRGAGK